MGMKLIFKREKKEVIVINCLLFVNFIRPVRGVFVQLHLYSIQIKILIQLNVSFIDQCT